MEQTAVIKETLRLAVPTPAGLPRVVPPPGAVISGVRIPGGVRVSPTSVYCQPFLITSTERREPERRLRLVFRRDFLSAIRICSRPVAPARLQISRCLAREFLEGAPQLPRHKVSAENVPRVRVTDERDQMYRVAWRIVNFTSPLLTCSVVSTFVKIRPGRDKENLLAA